MKKQSSKDSAVLRTALMLLTIAFYSFPAPAQTPTPTPITKPDPPTVQTPSTVGRITKWTGASKNGFGIIGDSIITESGGNLGIDVTNPSDKLTVGGGISATGPINTSSYFSIGRFRAFALDIPKGNLFAGFAAGNANATGDRNSFFGHNAGLFNGSGYANSFFGNSAGYSNTSGVFNSFFGLNTGLSNTTGFSNAFFGAIAGGANSIGSNNSFFGASSGFRSTSGSNNAFFGDHSGFNNTTGNTNSFFGVSAGQSNTTESNNTFIGANSNGAAGISNATAIGANAVVSQSNSVVLGNNASVGIGISAPQAKLHVIGSTAGRFDGNVTINGGLNVTSVNANNLSNVGTINLSSNPVDWSALKNVPSSIASGGNFVAKTGDTMTGTLNLPGNGLVAGGNQFVLSGGNVGIGTANPAFKLDVAGSMRTNSIDLPTGTINSLAGSLRLQGTTTQQGTTGGFLDLAPGNFYYPGGTVTLGAGTNSPQYGSGQGSYIKLFGNDYDYGGDILIASGHGYGSINGQGTGGTITLATSTAYGGNYPPPGPIVFKIGGNERFRVNGDGNVGIGTDTPDAALVVRGGDAGPTFKAVNSNNNLAGQFDGNVTINGNLTVSGSSSGFTISDGAVTTSKLADNAVVANKIANSAVTESKLADSAVTGPKIATGQVVKSLNSLTDNVTLVAGDNVTITPSANTLTISASTAVQKVNTQQVALLRWYEARSGISFPVGVNPQEMAFDGSNVWVVNGGSNSVTKFSANDGTVIGDYAVGGGPNEVLFDGANIWVANISGSLTKLRASDGAFLTTVPIDKPTGLTFDGTFIWVANNNSGTLTKVRASDGTATVATGVNGNPFKIAFDGTYVWDTLPFHGLVARFHTTNGSTVGSNLNIGANPQGLAFDGANMWVALHDENVVKKIRVSDSVIIGTYAVGTGPSRLVFDGNNIWVSNTGSNSVTKLRASDGVRLGDFAAGSGPVGIVFDGANVLVSNSSGNTISKF